MCTCVSRFDLEPQKVQEIDQSGVLQCDGIMKLLLRTKKKNKGYARFASKSFHYFILFWKNHQNQKFAWRPILVQN